MDTILGILSIILLFGGGAISMIFFFGSTAVIGAEIISGKDWHPNFENPRTEKEIAEHKAKCEAWWDSDEGKAHLKNMIELEKIGAEIRQEK